MGHTKLHALAEFGQSIWLDYINRRMIESGELRQWVERGLRGLTSNPSIFNQVVSGCADYDGVIVRAREAGQSTFGIYDEITTNDIRDAADIFMPVYQQTQGLDGYVSLEINPQLAHDTQASVAEGRTLFDKVGRPNLMIKVPATPAGFPVVSQLIGAGVNVNVTLIFSVEQYVQTVHAYWDGLKQLSETKGDLSRVHSVASVFVSRVDTVADRLIDERLPTVKDPAGQKLLEACRGRAAVANCRLILEVAREMFSSEHFRTLCDQGAQAQRVLWGSTSTKNPQYSDIKYVSELIARPTVNTIPQKTLEAFLDHGTVREALTQPAADAEAVLLRLSEYDISVNQICRQLLDDGVTAFEKAFQSLLSAIEQKARELCPHA